MPLQGFRRFRKHQVGVQSSFASNAAATRVLPYRGAISIDPALETPDVDTGSLDPILPPFAGAAQYEGQWEGKLAFDDAPWLWAGLLKGVNPTTITGSARRHTFQAASLTADSFVHLTDQWGDDVTTDWIHGGSGVIDELTLGFEEELSAWDVDATLLFARATFGGPTGGLTVDSNPTWVYGADTEFFMDTVVGSIGTTKWTDALHTLSLRIGANNDQKRFANGSNTRFQLAGFGRGGREIELTVGVAKTTETIAERQRIDDAPPAETYCEIRVTSPTMITGSTPYAMSIRLPVRLVSAEDTEFAENNTGYTFTYQGRYNSTLGYAIRVVVDSASTVNFA